ncbi:hypothetical protein L6R53_21910 [Myxococcota bacterium]|nr:hypothetical protein [Myxococcota bacterium]
MQRARLRLRSSLLLAGLGLGTGLPGGACHLGVPPRAAGAAVHLVGVDVAAAEPALADALRQGLADAFAARGLAGGPDPLTLRVVEATTSSAAATEALRVHRARLAVELQLLGASPRAVVLRAERAYPADPQDGLAAASARAAAFQALAAQLSEDAALWLSSAPGAVTDPGRTPSPGSRP